MASEPFDATDDNGIRVTGTVDVFRDRKGAFYDPKSPYYKNPRYADAHFDYFNTREACTIDQKVLSDAMQRAFKSALERFGIPEPNSDKIRSDVSASINATRQQCILNADKYVSNETFSSTNWETGKAVGSLTAKAYAAVPDSRGGTQTVVARENSWPASGVKPSGSAGAPILSRGVVMGGGGSESASSGSGDPKSPTQGAPPQQARGATGISSSQPVRILGRQIVNQSPASAFDGSAPAPGRQDPFGDHFDTGAPSSNSTPRRNPNVPVASPEPNRPIGIVSGKPTPSWPTPLPLANLFGSANASGNVDWFTALAGSPESDNKPAASLFDNGAVVTDDASLSGGLPGRLAAVLAGVNPTQLAAPVDDGTQGVSGGQPVRRLVRVSGSNSPTPSIGSGAPAAPIGGSDTPNSSGDLADWIAALAGVAPHNPVQWASSPQNDELRGLYQDDPARLLWSVR